MPGNFGFNPSSSTTGISSGANTPAQAHFTGTFDMPYMMPGQTFYQTPQGPATPQYVPDSSFGSAHQVATTNPSNAPQWYFDSGATYHITNSLQNLELAQPTSHHDGIMVSNGSSLQVTHTDKGLLPTPSAQFCLSHVLHSPHITHNLISVYQFAKDNRCLLTFDSNGLVIQDKNTLQTLYQGPYHKRLYPILNSSKAASSGISPTAFVSTSSSAILWHNKLGHASSSLFSSSIKQHSLPVSNPL